MLCRLPRGKLRDRSSRRLHAQLQRAGQLLPRLLPLHAALPRHRLLARPGLAPALHRAAVHLHLRPALTDERAGDGNRLVCDWYGIAVRLLFNCCAIAVRLLCDWYVMGTRLLCHWYVAAVRLVCARYAIASGLARIPNEGLEASVRLMERRWQLSLPCVPADARGAFGLGPCHH